MTNSILKLLVKTMSEVGQTDLSGKRKKDLVLKIIFDEMDLDEYLEDFLMHIIDLLINVENNKIIFNKKIKKSILSCFSKR